MERCRIVVLVAAPGAEEILVQANGGLPATAIDGEATTPAIEVAVEGLLGLATPMLRVTTLGVDPARDHAPTLLAVELGPLDGAPPAGFRWTTSADVTADLEPPEVTETVRWWLGRLAAGPTPLDPPWSLPGWFDGAAGWMGKQMDELGTPASGPVRFHYLWPLAAILVAQSPFGRLFLKCPAPPYVNEWRVTHALGQRTPGAVPRLVAAEPDEGWLLMRDFGDRMLGDEPPAAWAGGLVRFAEIQRAWSDDPEGLRRAGVKARPLTELAAAIPDLVADEAIGSRLSAEQRAVVSAAVPRLIAACDRLDEIGPPETLVHGDLHPWNIATLPDGLVVFDWTDATITHPFVDLPIFLSEVGDIDLRRLILAAYLARWADALPTADLHEAAELALVVGSLNQAYAYRWLLGVIDPHDHLWLHGADAHWLVAAVDALDRGIAMRGFG